MLQFHLQTPNSMKQQNRIDSACQHGKRQSLGRSMDDARAVVEQVGNYIEFFLAAHRQIRPFG